MTKIITVLRSGGDFNLSHVLALRDECNTYAPGVKFHCLSDNGAAPGLIELEHGWPGWWAKMEMFKIPGPCLYLDLDTVVTSSLKSILWAVEDEYEERLIVLRDFNPKQRLLGTGLMGWNNDQSWIYKAFKEAPRFHQEHNRSPRYWGDQGFMERLVRKAPVPPAEMIAYWQDKVPGQVVSYKKDCLLNGVPEATSVVCFHGNPRPWDTNIREVSA